MGVLDGKVVLVTGGGNGIGRECALIAAREGAKVLVNDLGGGERGGDEARPKKRRRWPRSGGGLGGTAVSNSKSVTDMGAVKDMVTQAIDELGGLHAVINPAGILRDGMFHKMPDEDWDIVVAVHLRGSYNVCRAAIEHFQESERGQLRPLHLDLRPDRQHRPDQLRGRQARHHGAFTRAGGGRSLEGRALQHHRADRLDRVSDRHDPDQGRSGGRADEGDATGAAPRPAGQAGGGAGLAALQGRQRPDLRRSETLELFSQPRPVEAITSPDTWTVQQILTDVLPKMAPKFTSLAGPGQQQQQQQRQPA